MIQDEFNMIQHGLSIILHHRTNGGRAGQTNRRTGLISYRDAWTHLNRRTVDDGAITAVDPPRDSQGASPGEKEAGERPLEDDLIHKKEEKKSLVDFRPNLLFPHTNIWI